MVASGPGLSLPSARRLGAGLGGASGFAGPGSPPPPQRRLLAGARPNILTAREAAARGATGIRQGRCSQSP
jgi:hypothetical protein